MAEIERFAVGNRVEARHVHCIPIVGKGRLGVWVRYPLEYPGLVGRHIVGVVNHSFGRISAGIGDHRLAEVTLALEVADDHADMMDFRQHGSGDAADQEVVWGRRRGRVVVETLAALASEFALFDHIFKNLRGDEPVLFNYSMNTIRSFLPRMNYVSEE